MPHPPPSPQWLDPVSTALSSLKRVWHDDNTSACPNKVHSMKTALLYVYITMTPYFRTVTLEKYKQAVIGKTKQM